MTTGKLDRREFMATMGATAALAIVPAVAAVGNPARVGVVGLKVDNLNQPIGLENTQPRFSWRLESPERNVRQSAYRILVGNSEAMARESRADLWDSGKVSSRKSVGIRYAGRELVSRQQCWWRVQVWDELDNPSTSEPSRWEMGLLDPKEWEAQWLAVEDEVARADRVTGLRWIKGVDVPRALLWKFRLTVELPARARNGLFILGGEEDVAGLWIDGRSQKITPRPRYSIGMGSLGEYPLAELASGSHVIAVQLSAKQPKDTAESALLTAFFRIVLEDGRTLRIPAGPDWRTSMTDDAGWFKPSYDDRAWERATIATSHTKQPWPPTSAMHLRKEFALDRQVVRARLYATALGAYEACLNGQRVGNALLTPESTLYSRRILYRVYDVKDLLQQGINTLGFTVGDGWYASTMVLAGRYAWGPPPRRLFAQLELTFTDGSREVLATGPGWHIGPSPIIRSEIYNGEICDARLQQTGWDASGFDDSNWESAELADRPTARLVAQVSPPIRIKQTLNPVAISQPAAGIFVFDFGQNFAGWCRLKARGPSGTRIEMRFAEVLQPSGEVDQTNLREAKQTDVFILRGDSAEEHFEPKFTYHGFRYVQVAGLPLAPPADSLEGVVIHSDLDETGTLRIDDPLIKRIWRNTLWTQRSNFMGIPTDCPQRDERLGWMADAGIFWDTAAFNMDVTAFARRQMDNAADNQDSDGSYAMGAPWPRPQPNPTPAWSDGAVILPWTTWQRYGDLAIIEDNWEAMNRFVKGILADNPNYLWCNGRTDVGDWLAVDDKYMLDPGTPHELIGTAYWAHSVELLAQMGSAIARSSEAKSLRRLHKEIRAAFIATFVKDDGRIGSGSQSSYLLALKYGLVPDRLVAKAASHLVEDIRRRGGALSTGILGTQYLADVLTDQGYAQLAYDLILRTEYPSWGYMIAKGATTMWEGWDGKVWSGPNGQKMPNSYNHCALGAICGFLFRRVAGIDAAVPGFESIAIRPVLDARVKRGGGDYDSILGRISTDWEQGSDGRFELTATIPANTVARVHLPARRNSRIEEGGKEMRVIRRSDREAVVEIGSGDYRFVVLPG